MEELVYYSRSCRVGENYADRTIRPGRFEYSNLNSLLARFFMSCHYNYGPVLNWRDQCVGITSMLPSGEHMPMFDYDGKNIRNKIREDVEKLQKKFNLGDAWVYQTKRGYHVYFFTDGVHFNYYLNMLEHVECCKGFKQAAVRSQSGTLRVSAKYTEFDIEFLYILRAGERRVQRLLPKAYIVQSLLQMGQECGTHFASLFPQWALYREDREEWKPGAKKRRRGSKHATIELMKSAGKGKFKGKRIRKLRAAPGADQPAGGQNPAPAGPIEEAYPAPPEAPVKNDEVKKAPGHNLGTTKWVVDSSVSVTNDTVDYYWGAGKYYK